ncbi:MAG: hypothetical protein M3421_01540 [Bacteroidota bacterium]|nr:hypothetical protein [Bacteroidota bacterium]
MKNFLILTFFFLPTFSSLGQRILKVENFNLNTPFLEPEERTLSQNLGAEGLISIAKNKGTHKGTSIYYLEWRRVDLSLNWSSPVRIGSSENILHLEVTDHQILLFSVLHNESQKITALHVDIYDRNQGHHIAEKLLLEHQVESWNYVINKGAVNRDFQSYIASGSKRGYVTPLEYRYKIEFSPDGTKYLFYRYDYSKPNLQAEAFVFDKELTLLKKAMLPIDNHYINHSLTLSPEGNIYLLNSKNDGTVAAIYYNLDDKTSRFLEISPSNSDRSHYNLEIEDEYHVLISYINQRKNNLEGISLSKFNFKEEKIDWINYQELNKSLDSLAAGMGESIQKNNFELIKQLQTHSGTLFLLEQRELLAPGRQYSSNQVEDKDHWRPGKGKIVSGSILLIYFGKDNELKWSQLISKNQVTNAKEGLNTIGFSYNVFENDIKILYAVGSGSVSQLNHVSIDWDGKVTKNELPNEHNIILVRPYTQWLNPNEVVIVGKNGFSGRSSLIMKYKVP